MLCCHLMEKQLNTKRRVQQWKSLLRKKEQDQRAYNKYMAKINPRFYDAHDRRLSNAEVYAKFGYIKEWHDNKALRLLNVLREDNRKIAQFRHDAHLKLIYKLLPLGGIVITEQMNYHSLAECARINPLQNGGERNSAAMQREMHQVQFDQEDLSLQTHHRSNKSAQSATSGTSSHRVTGTHPVLLSNQIRLIRAKQSVCRPKSSLVLGLRLVELHLPPLSRLIRPY